MNMLTHNIEIQNRFSTVRHFSFEEKKNSLLDKEKVNYLLDKILEFKQRLKEKCFKIDSLITDIEKITWFNNLDEESHILINDLISAIKDLHSTLIRQYVIINELRQKGIAKDEVRYFKNSIDNLKELYQDLESVFFFLPQFPEFKESTKQLSLI